MRTGKDNKEIKPSAIDQMGKNLSPLLPSNQLLQHFRLAAQSLIVALNVAMNTLIVTATIILFNNPSGQVTRNFNE